MWKAAPGALTVLALMLIGGGQASAQAAPPGLDYACSPAPADCTGWYRSAVTLRWNWDTIRASPTGGDCSSPHVFSQDTRGTRVFCEVTDNMTGEYTGRPVTIHIDRTPPSVSPAPARPPDYNGWFNHPVSIAFTGTDGTSGVQSCTSANYGGPDAAGVALGGSCQDVAGNTATGAFALNYDSTPPAPPDVSAMPNDNRVTLRWAPPADAEMIEVARMTGTGQPALLFRGAATSFTDRELKNGKRHRYLVVSVDRAGNRAVDRASAVPTSSPLLSPARRARLAQPPLLVWESVKRATYYNVQLYHGREKILSRWPRAEQFQLSETWRFGGQRRRLKPGSYTWFVFPAFGERSDRRFGKLLGKSSFRIVG
jgi:hypothetical protein